MCRFISFWHNPLNGDVVVSDLNSHSNTQEALNLNQNVWCEGHYLPDGEIELRKNPGMRIPENYNENFKQRFPDFSSFFNWAIMSTSKNGVFIGFLDLSSLTSAEGLTLPKECGFLDLRSLTSVDKALLRKKGYPI